MWSRESKAASRSLGSWWTTGACAMKAPDHGAFTRADRAVAGSRPHEVSGKAAGMLGEPLEPNSQLRGSRVSYNLLTPKIPIYDVRGKELQISTSSGGLTCKRGHSTDRQHHQVTPPWGTALSQARATGTRLWTDSYETEGRRQLSGEDAL